MRLGHGCERSHLRLHRRWGVTFVGGRSVSRAERSNHDPPYCRLRRADSVAERDRPAGPVTRPAGRLRRRRGGPRGAGQSPPAPHEPAQLAGDRRGIGDPRRTVVVGSRRRRRATGCLGRRTQRSGAGGALRVGQAMEGGTTALVGVWQRAPLQALARLHALAAADLTDGDSLGRPRQDPEVAARLDLVTRLVTGASTAPAPVLAAVAHGELLALAPFGSGDGVIARAVSRLVTIGTGLDPHGLGVPEVYWMRRAEEYQAAAGDFASGVPEGCPAVAVDELRCAGRWCARSTLDRGSGCEVVRTVESGRRSEKSSARRPLARFPGYQACGVGCVGWPRRSCDALR